MSEPTPITAGERSEAAYPWGWLVGLFGVALAIRLIYVLVLHPVGRFLYSDMLGAYQGALTLANPHHVIDVWDVAKPRAMAIVGSLIVRWFGQGSLQAWGLLQAILSAATVPLTFVGTHRFLGRRTAIVTAALLTIDFLALGFAGLLMIETYLMFFLALAFACLDPERPLLTLCGGLALGLGGLFKAQALPMAVVWGAMLVLWSAVAMLRRRDPVAGFLPKVRAWVRAGPLLSAILLGVGLLAVQVPESMEISRVLGHRTIFPPYGGQNFFLGHCDVKLLTLDARPQGGYLLSLSAKAVELDEPWPDVTFYVSVLDSAFYVREGMKCLRRSIPHALRWGAEQLLDALAGVPGSTLDPWPVRMDQPVLTRVFNFTLAYALVPLALWGLWRRRRELGAWLTIGGPLAAVWGLALLFSGNPRYREPFDAFILAGAAVGLLALWDRYAPRSMRADANTGNPGEPPVSGQA